MGDLREKYKAIVVGVGGPPQSGKTVFLSSLNDLLRAHRPSNFVLMVKANPDGEGLWSRETSSNVRKQIRMKGKFNEQLVQQVLSQFVGIAMLGTLKLVLVDLGGIRSPENEQFLQHCTHFVCLSSDKQERDEWVAFAEQCGCKTLGIFDSELVRVSGAQVLDMTIRSTINIGETTACGCVRNLDRDVPNVCYQEQMDVFSSWLVMLVEDFLHKRAQKTQAAQCQTILQAA